MGSKGEGVLFWTTICGIVAAALWLGYGTIAEAQCPGGICPTQQNQWQAATGQRPQFRAIPRRMPVRPHGIWKAVVRVEGMEPGSTRMRGGKNFGSGVLIKHQGRIAVLTVFHVVKGVTRLIVKTCDGAVLPAKLLFSDPKADVAILSVNPPADRAYTTATLATVAPDVGEMVQAVGYGMHGQMGIIEGNVTQYVRFEGMEKGSRDVLEMTGTAAEDGDSGGPIFNKQHEVVALITGITDENTVDGPWSGRVIKLCAAHESQWHLLPWRANAAELSKVKAQVAAMQIQAATPPPLPMPQPSVDIKEVHQRITNLESQQQEQLKLIDANTNRLVPLEETADKAKALVGQWPELQAALAKLDEAKAQADQAAKDAGNAIDVVTGVAGKATAAVGTAGEAKAAVGAALDEKTGILSKLKDRLDEKVASTVTAKVAARLAEKTGWSIPTALGVTGGGLGLLALILVVFLKREGDRASAGEPILAQKIAARTPTTVDDLVADKLAAVFARLDEKVDAIATKAKAKVGK